MGGMDTDIDAEKNMDMDTDMDTNMDVDLDMDMDIWIVPELSLLKQNNFETKKNIKLKYTPSPPGGWFSGEIYFVQGGGGKLGKRLAFADEYRTA